MGTRRVTRRAALAGEARGGETMDVGYGVGIGAGIEGGEVTSSASDALEGDALEGIVRRIGYAPIVRLDESRREIELCATSEAVDSYGTIFSYEASKEAFSRWIGNVREMHERKAVGRRVAVRSDDYARKVFVTIRISRGAQDTWEKVRDGTLRGASIGAANVKWLPTLCPAADGTKVLLAEKYDLVELSLVDNPSNPDALGITFVRDAVPDVSVLDPLDEEEPRGNAEGAEDSEPERNHGAQKSEAQMGGRAKAVEKMAQGRAPSERSAGGTDFDGERLHAAARAVLEGCGCVVCEAAMAALADVGDVTDEGEALIGREEDGEEWRIREGEQVRMREARLARALEASLRVSLWGSARRLDALDEQVRAVRSGVDESGAAVARVAEQVNRMAGSVSETLASALGRMDDLGARMEHLEAQPMPGGPAARAMEKQHPLHAHDRRDQTVGLAPSAQEQYRALEALAGRLADPQAQIVVAAELIRLQREGNDGI